MNRQLKVDLVNEARNVADNTEQIAQEVRRMASAIEMIVQDLTIICDAIRPLIEWLNSTEASPPAKVLASTGGMR